MKNERDILIGVYTALIELSRLSGETTEQLAARIADTVLDGLEDAVRSAK